MDLETLEKAEKQLKVFITRRDTERLKTEGERREEELWRESERQYQAKRQAELTLAWIEYHKQAAERALANGEAIAARHQAQIEALLGGTKGEDGFAFDGARGALGVGGGK